LAGHAHRHSTTHSQQVGAPEEQQDRHSFQLFVWARLCHSRPRQGEEPVIASLANDLVNPNPAAPDYIGRHPGNAFMELQFYGPGYVPQFGGFGCSAHQYCAAMTIDSFNLNQNTGVANAAACDDYILVDRQRVRARAVHTERQHLHLGPVRLPSRVQHRQPTGQHLVGAHLQPGLLR
jgi:hypothetical protein